MNANNKQTYKTKKDLHMHLYVYLKREEKVEKIKS